MSLKPRDRKVDGETGAARPIRKTMAVDYENNGKIL
jgi:hypothetical protein